MDREYEPTQEEEYSYSKQQEAYLQQMDEQVKSKQQPTVNNEQAYLYIKNNGQWELYERNFANKQEALEYAQANLRGFSYLIGTAKEIQKMQERAQAIQTTVRDVEKGFENLQTGGKQLGKMFLAPDRPLKKNETRAQRLSGYKVKGHPSLMMTPYNKKYQQPRKQPVQQRQVQRQPQQVQQRQGFYFNPSGRPQSQRSSITPPKKQFTFNPKPSLNLRDRWRK